MKGDATEIRRLTGRLRKGEKKSVFVSLAKTKQQNRFNNHCTVSVQDGSTDVSEEDTVFEAVVDSHTSRTL